MPKETVYGEQMGVLLDENFTPAAEQPKPIVPIVEVRWHRDAGYVQIVSKATDPDDGRFASSDDAPYDEHRVTDGYHVDLNRTAINNLIRNLRRARDQAFGRDE